MGVIEKIAAVVGLVGAVLLSAKLVLEIIKLRNEPEVRRAIKDAKAKIKKLLTYIALVILLVLLASLLAVVIMLILDIQGVVDFSEWLCERIYCYKAYS